MCFCCVSHNAANEIIWRAKREGRVMTDQEVDIVTQRIEHDKPLLERVTPARVTAEQRPDMSGSGKGLGMDLEEAAEAVKKDLGFSDAAWEAFSEANSRNVDLDNEVSKLRDIARRAAILARWFSREDFPFVAFTPDEGSALNADAEAMVLALNRHGYYPEGWGE